MPSYLVETFLARAQSGALREEQARSAALELARDGVRVSFECAIHVPEDEICFLVFDARSTRDVALAMQRAGLDVLRVVEAVASRKETT
jgi:hypothetical protein